MVSLHFPCSMHGSGLSFQRKCLLTGLLSSFLNAWSIISQNSLMNSSLSALMLASTEYSLYLGSPWSLLWSRGGCSAASHWHTSPVHLLDSPIVLRLTVDRHCRTCSLVFGGISSSTLSSITVSVTSWTFCVSGAFPVGFPTVLTSFPDAVVPSSM